MQSAWRAAAALAFAAAGCGRIGFDATGADATAPPGAFETPVRIDELSSAAEDDDPTLTGDLLEIYFTAASDLWRATRASAADAWSAPARVAELASAATQQTPELSADGLTMYFARGTATDHDIYMTTRTDRDSTWAAPVRVAELSSANDDTAPAIAPDGLVLVLSRGAVTIDAVLYIATRPTTSAAWSTPVPIDLDTISTTENQAWLGDDVIYYTSNTPGQQRIRRAARTGPTMFGPSEPVDGIDLPGDSSDPWLDPTQRVIFFEHDNNLYSASR